MVNCTAGLDWTQCRTQARKPQCWGKAVKKKEKGMTTKLTKLKLISCPEVVVLVVFV